MNEEPLILHNETGQNLRIDKFLAQELDKFSRSYIQKLISQGAIILEGIPVIKKSETITPGAVVEVFIPEAEEADLQPEDIPLDVIFENSDLIVVNKPAGMVVHPALGHSSGTLVQAVLAHAPEIEGVGGVRRPGLVHRLDQNTSGVIVLAKNGSTHQLLQDQFRTREVGKVYLALVDGRPPTPQGRVEVAIGRDPRYRQRMAAVLDRDGKEAISEFFTIQEFPKHSFLKVLILTGRTHQIRIHLDFLGCSIVGDTVYGRKKPSIDINRQFLHAYQLSIRIPGEDQKRTFEAPLATELKAVLEELQERNKGV